MSPRRQTQTADVVSSGGEAMTDDPLRAEVERRMRECSFADSPILRLGNATDITLALIREKVAEEREHERNRRRWWFRQLQDAVIARRDRNLRSGEPWNRAISAALQAMRRKAGEIALPKRCPTCGSDAQGVTVHVPNHPLHGIAMRCPDTFHYPLVCPTCHGEADGCHDDFHTAPPGEEG